MSTEEFVAVLIGGLVLCYWAGVKCGAAVRAIKNLGRSA